MLNLYAAPVNHIVMLKLNRLGDLSHRFYHVITLFYTPQHRAESLSPINAAQCIVVLEICMLVSLPSITDV